MAKTAFNALQEISDSILSKIWIVKKKDTIKKPVSFLQEGYYAFLYYDDAALRLFCSEQGEVIVDYTPTAGNNGKPLFYVQYKSMDYDAALDVLNGVALVLCEMAYEGDPPLATADAFKYVLPKS